MNRRRIIFVDDEVNALDSLRRTLHKHRNEWNMTFVRTSDEALGKMSEAAYDVIVTDLSTKPINGAELLRQVAERFPDTARIVLTGSCGEITDEVIKYAHQFLSKPTDADSVRIAVARACQARKVVFNDRVRSLISSCDVLPSLPRLYMEITRAVESDASDVKTVSRIISREMGMAAKILQLVNSSFFGIGRRISSIDQAVGMLGFIRIKALVLTEHIFKQFALPKEVRSLSAQDLWLHSTLTAEGARRITALEGQRGDRPDQAFAAGLLHDVGILVLASGLPTLYQEVLEVSASSQRPVWEVEHELLQADHAAVGSCLLTLWGLPPRLVEAVALHHQPASLEYDGLCATTAVHAADALCEEMLDDRGPHVDMGYMERIGLSGRVDLWRKEIQTICSGAVQQAQPVLIA